MKTIHLMIALIFISGCSSTKYISTEKYSKEITGHCIQNLPEHLKENRDSRADCAMKSASTINFAYRIYETRAANDLKECQESNASQESVDACFAKKQDAYYQNVVSQNTK